MDFTHNADTLDCIASFLTPPTSKPMYDTISSLVCVRYDLVALLCMIWSCGSFLYDINLGATATTILRIRGVQIPIDLVSSATDSYRRSVVLFKPMSIPTSDPKSEFLYQSSSLVHDLQTSPWTTLYAWDISHALVTTYHPYCHSLSALTEYLKQRLRSQRAKRLGRSLPAQVEQSVQLEHNRFHQGTKCGCMGQITHRWNSETFQPDHGSTWWNLLGRGQKGIHERLLGHSIQGMRRRKTVQSCMDPRRCWHVCCPIQNSCRWSRVPPWWSPHHLPFCK